MDIRVLVLDDKVQTAGTEILKSLSPLVADTAPFSLSGSGPTSLSLQEIDGEQITLTFVCNNSDEADVVKEQLEGGDFAGEFDLVLLDDNWGMTAEEVFAGQKILLEPVFNHVRGRAGGAPLICLWTQHWDDAYRTGLLAETLRRKPFWGENRVRGLAKSNYPGLLLLMQDVIAVSHLQRENAELREELASTRAFAARDLDLLKSERFKDSIINHGPFLRVGERLAPFFQWKDGKYDGVRDDLKSPFSAGLIFESRDSVWVGTVCETLAQALGSQLHTVEAPGLLARGEGEWETLFAEEVPAIYGRAMTEQVVVIRAEQIDWPEKFENAKEHQEWQKFVSKFALFLRHAAEINNGKMPANQDILSQIFSERPDDGAFPFSGKILWLLAYGARPAEELLAPVESILPPTILLDFPTEDQVRRDFLKLYARKLSCEFNAAGLTLAVRRTRGLTFGELIGDTQFAVASFLSLAVNKAKLEARKRYEEAATERERKRVEPVITERIVEEALEELGGRLPVPTQADEGADLNAARHPAVPTRSAEKNTERLMRAEQKLNKLQAAASQARLENPDIKATELRTDIARILGINPANLSIYARTYQNEFKILFRDPEKTGKWPDLGRIHTFKRFLP